MARCRTVSLSPSRLPRSPSTTAGIRAVVAQKPLTASGAWVKLPAAGETTAAAFVVVDNPTMYDVYVVSASSDVAGEVQFWQKSADGRAEAVKELPAPAFGKLSMTPDGAYMLLAGLTRPLKAGDTVTLTIATDSGQALTVAAIVCVP